MEVPRRAGERSQLFLLALWAPGLLLAVSRAITAGAGGCSHGTVLLAPLSGV